MKLNIYQMYMENEYQFGFRVRKDSWSSDRSAEVEWIEFVIEGKPIKGKPPYFGGFKNPPGHPRAGKTMGPRLVKLVADWMPHGEMTIDTGGNYCWIWIK